MTFSVEPYNLPLAIKLFFQAFGTGVLLFLLASVIFSIVRYKEKFGKKILGFIDKMIKEFVNTSFHRICAVALLTWKECIRMKALYVFVIFAILFMFAGWFIGHGNVRTDIQIPQYVMLVLTSSTWMVLLMSLLLSCWVCQMISG